MRAFFYTLILTAVLVASMVYLRSIKHTPPEEKLQTESSDVDPRSPMVVHSDPAPRSTIDPELLAETNHDALYETGVELLDLWHVPEAVDVFETLVDQYDDARASLKLVECYSHPTVASERKAKTSWEKANDAVAAGEGDSLIVAAYRSLFIDRAPAEAVARFTEVVDRGSGHLAYRSLLATALLLDGNIEKAQRHLKDVLDGDPSLGRARELLIRCYVASGERETAELQARELAALYPEEPYPYVLLSRVLTTNGDTSAAAEFCNNALRIDNRYIPAIVARAHLYVTEGDLGAARVSFEKLLLFDEPVLSAIGREGVAYIDFLSGRFDEATQAMDDATRLAMTAGSPRLGLALAFRTVDYLCELGRTDAAAAVLDRWVTRHGEIPDQLGKLRLSISLGRAASSRQALQAMEEDAGYRDWIRNVGWDVSDLRAMTYVRDNDFDTALKVLRAAPASGHMRRAYLTGFALFQSGEAEAAAIHFGAVSKRLHGLVFPFRTDPVLYVQTHFFLAETALASGETEIAQENYARFLDFWGDADWDLEAINRAREKLQNLSYNTPKE